MAQKESSIQKTADKLSKYICICAYISMYPALLIFIESWLNIYLPPIFNFYSDTVSGIYFFVSLMFPAIVWLIFTKIFKEIHPAITISFSIPFIIWQFIILIGIFLFYS